MREILFRGKGKYTKDWIYGYYGKTGCDDETEKHYIIKSELNVNLLDMAYPFYFMDYEVLPETVGQYTELIDKNGKMIFEGDILKCDYLDLRYSSENFGIAKKVIERTTICVCETDDYNPCFVLRNIENEYDIEYDFVKCDLLELEVIGNIYDNPELLKENENE